jgi:hypothetical protein
VRSFPSTKTENKVSLKANPKGGVIMMNNAINYVASSYLRWDGLDAKGFAILLLVLFALSILTEFLIASDDWYNENKIPQAKHTSIVYWVPAKFFHLH